MLLTIVHTKGEPDEVRQDRGATAPGLDHFVTTRRANLVCLLQKVSVYKRIFPNERAIG